MIVIDTSQTFLQTLWTTDKEVRHLIFAIMKKRLTSHNARFLENLYKKGTSSMRWVMYEMVASVKARKVPRMVTELGITL